MGIKFLSHLTIEAKAHIEQADKVLYLVNNPMMKEWIQKANANTENLDIIYKQHPLRQDCYNAITHYILESMNNNQNVCVVLYGHPTVFSEPALNATILAKSKGYDTQILPGISAEDCLFADLMIDPARSGCQSFEATDFLLYKRSFSPESHLILWQPNIIGEIEHPVAHDNQKGILLLFEYLRTKYDLEHETIIYEAAQLPMFKAQITKFPLKDLPKATLPKVCLLYLPPLCKSNIDYATLEYLGIAP